MYIACAYVYLFYVTCAVRVWDVVCCQCCVQCAVHVVCISSFLSLVVRVASIFFLSSVFCLVSRILCPVSWVLCFIPVSPVPFFASSL